MDIKVGVFKRQFQGGAFGATDVDTATLKKVPYKYELHKNGKCFAAGMETISETIDEISATFSRKCDSDDVVVSSPQPRQPNLFSLTVEERIDFAAQAPLLSYEKGFLSH